MEGLARIWFDLGATQQYYPLLHSSFWVQHRLWGDATLGYHLVNLLLHIGATWLVYAILKKLGIRGAALAAAIFAVHPLQVETVAWITEQKNTLSAVFYLSAMLSYLNFDVNRRATSYWWALSLFVLGLLSKTVTATLPAALLVIFWWQRGELSWRRDVRPLVPLFMLGALAGLFTAWVEQSMIGAEGAYYDLTLIERFLQAGRVIWFYVAKLLWPVELTFIYPRWTIDSSQWQQWLYPLAVVAGVAACWGVRARSRAPLAGALFFIGTLFPVLGFFNVYPFRFSYVADHFQYLACLGLVVPISAAVASGLERLAETGRFVGRAACVTLVGALTLTSAVQSLQYRDAENLYLATLERNSACWLAHNNLGVIYLSRDSQEQAIEQFQKVLAINPDYADAHNNLGAALVNVDRTTEAIRHFELAIRLRADFPLAENNLGKALLNSQQYEEAIDHFRRAVASRSDYAEAHNNLGVALLHQGQTREASEHLNEAIALDPEYAEAHNNLATALFHEGRLQEALEHRQQAVRIKPDLWEAQYQLADLLVHLGQPADAIEHFEQALRLKPNDAEVENKLGVALFQAGRPQDALVHYQQAVRLVPDYVEAWANTATAQAALGRSTEAVAAAERALELARTQKDSALAQQIDAWLNSFRAGGPLPAAPPRQE